MKILKRVLSSLLILSIFLSIIYIPTSAASVVLPDGTTMNSGETTATNSGYTAIGSASAFKKIAPGGKYYLTANIDLTASGVNFSPLAGGSNSASNIIIDGCGYTITTNKPLFEELPGNSGTEGSHSQVRNLVIKGNITVTYAELEGYSNGYSVGALAGKANGGRFTNIVNNATVTVSGTTNVNVRVGGIVGSVFNDTAVFTNCLNNAPVTAYAAVGDSALYGVGGIVGYLANSASGYKTTLKYCKNVGTVKNASTATSHTYAGAIFGNKRDACIVSMTNCTNNGSVYANNYYGQGVFQGVYGSKDFTGITTSVVTISTAADFKKIAAGGQYALAANIDLTAPGVNFTTLAGGVNADAVIDIDGLGYTVTTNKPLIAELPGGGSANTMHSDIRNLTINGNIELSYSDLVSYTNGNALGALVGKANGGRFINITNNANIIITDTVNRSMRVGGIVGVVFNDTALFQNCVNNGNIRGRVGSGDSTYAMGGIIGYVANSATGLTTTFTNCRNTGNVINTSTDASYSYAGSIFGNKRDACVITLKGCSNTGDVSATAYGGKDVFQAFYSTKNLTSVTISDVTAIGTAAQFKTIAAGGRYYLTANIDLTASGVNFTTLAGGNNSASVIILDGCGYTVTTNKPLFKEIPGGGAGKHSEITDLNIKGNIAVTLSDASTYTYMVGALACKTYGGIFKNITNNATITVSGQAGWLVGGLFGGIFYDTASLENCSNKGAISADVITSNGTHAVAGIVGHIGLDGVTITECSNTGAITNTSTSATGAYAGGIMGTKAAAGTTVTIRDCTNSGKIKAKTAYGHYYAISTYQRISLIKVISIGSAAEFAKIKGNGEYKLTANITLSTPNTNDFSGVIYGNGYTITTKSTLFKNDNGAKLYDVNVDLISLNINGRPLDSFAVVASSATDAAAKSIVDFVKSKYSITLPIKTPSDKYVGNAIYINLGNTYGGVRYGLDYGVNAKGYMEVYLDETSANISTYVSNFLKNKLTTTKASYDFFNDFGQKSFRYSFPTANTAQGYTYNESEDVVRILADGVTYIERTYTITQKTSHATQASAVGTKVKAYIIVMESDAKAHFEVYNASYSNVSSCDNSSNCGCKHVTVKTTGALVSEMEAKGKNVLAAANGGFFMKSAGCNTPWGIQIVNGTVNRGPLDVSTSTVYQRWFGVTKAGVPVTGDASTYESTYKGKLQYAIGGRYYGIKDGVYVQAGTLNAYDARTAVGHNANGDIVMMVIPGDDADATEAGATVVDVAQVFMDLDIDVNYMLNLDGGGSTNLIVENTGGSPVLTTPLYSGTSQRAIADIMAIVAD